MIRTAAFGMARSLFAVGVFFLFAAAVTMYGAYRLVRFVSVGAPRMPRRAAGFAVLVALVELGRALPPKDHPGAARFEKHEAKPAAPPDDPSNRGG